MKTWDKGIDTHAEVHRFTVGSDHRLDMLLAPYDVLGSIAHVLMLGDTGIVKKTEARALASALREIFDGISQGTFAIEKGVEDIHSQLEKTLTEKLGSTGRKVHAGRSRNDQVLLDIQMFTRHELKKTADLVFELFKQLLSLSEQHKDKFLPGFTHFQVAMRSSFGLWFGGYAESLADDMLLLQAAYKLANQNPLGSAAGFGTSLPIDRSKTTKLLAFEGLRYNAVAAQMSRGKIEQITAQSLSVLCGTISRLAGDICLYNSQNFGFIELDEAFTTGSSIMPHKKNPDVFELIRAKSNKIQALPFGIRLVTANLPSGYHRDYQVLKEQLFPALQEIQEILKILMLALRNIGINEEFQDQEIYRNTGSVDYVNKLVMDGMTFRDAYREVAEKIRNDEFQEVAEVEHTHEGSLGNLCHSQIRQKMEKTFKEFDYQSVERAYASLLEEDSKK